MLASSARGLTVTSVSVSSLNCSPDSFSEVDAVSRFYRWNEGGGWEGREVGERDRGRGRGEREVDGREGV